MECNRAFRERAKICVDWTAPRTTVIAWVYATASAMSSVHVLSVVCHAGRVSERNCELTRHGSVVAYSRMVRSVCGRSSARRSGIHSVSRGETAEQVIPSGERFVVWSTSRIPRLRVTGWCVRTVDHRRVMFWLVIAPSITPTRRVRSHDQSERFLG
jgi:hypothetical protein